MMGKRFCFHPITRIEGHAKVSLSLNEDNHVTDAIFQVLEFRGFERFMRGRQLVEAPLITPRICGLCSPSHHLASVKAVESAMDVDISSPSRKLREIVHLAGLLHSHLLHFFLLYSPDILLSDLSPEKRGFPELLKRHAPVVKTALTIRGFARRLLEVLGGSSIHPSAAVPGGFSKPLEHEVRIGLYERCKEILQLFMDLVSSLEGSVIAHINAYTSFPSNFLSLSSPSGLPLYDSDRITAQDSDGSEIISFEPAKYFDYIGERVVSWSYAKMPYIKLLGYPDGSYRVGPLARLNINKNLGSDFSMWLMRTFHLDADNPTVNTRSYNAARLVEIAYALERLRDLLDDAALERPTLPTGRLRFISDEGIGVVEAPRGTLIHHFKIDDEGCITDANLVVATVQNIPVINEEIKRLAERIIVEDGLSELRLYGAISTLIRDYDPCLSCSTHSFGFPLRLEIYNSDGTLVESFPKNL